MTTSEVKPVAWAFKQDWPRFQEDNQECRLLPNFYWGADLGENSYYEPLYDQSTIDALRAEVDAKQARIDSLMFEYCPEDMTPEQMEEWAKHQKPAGDTP